MSQNKRTLWICYCVTNIETKTIIPLNLATHILAILVFRNVLARFSKNIWVLFILEKGLFELIYQRAEEMDILSFLGFWKRLLSGFDWTPLKRSSMFILESCQVRKLEIGWQKNFKTGQSAIKWKLFGLQSHLTCCHLTIGSGVPVTNTSRKQSQNLLKNWWNMSMIMQESFPNKMFIKLSWIFIKE